MLLHASSVAISGRAVLLAGASGAGKSDMALRLVDDGAALVADDQTGLRIENGILTAFSPAPIQGLMEVRHVGLLHLPFQLSAPLVLYVDLLPSLSGEERLPDPETVFFLDHPVQRLRLPAFAASTPAKIRAVLAFSLVNDRNAPVCSG